MSKKQKKPFPNPRGVEGQNLYDYFFIVREISQLASTSCAKHGFSQWLPAISNRSFKFSCFSSELFSNCKVFFPLPLEFLVFTCDARDPINQPIMFRVLQLNIEVDVVNSSTFNLEGSSCENLIFMYLSTQIGFLIGWLSMSRALNQNTLTIQGEKISLSPRGDNNFNFRLSTLRLFTVKPRQMCVPACVQKVIFGSHTLFGMYAKIFSKIKIKMTGPTRNND